VVYHLDHPIEPRHDRSRNRAYSLRKDIPVFAEAGIVKREGAHPG
jgi:hypothetical protein